MSGKVPGRRAVRGQIPARHSDQSMLPLVHSICGEEQHPVPGANLRDSVGERPNCAADPGRRLSGAEHRGEAWPTGAREDRDIGALSRRRIPMRRFMRCRIRLHWHTGTSNGRSVRRAHGSRNHIARIRRGGPGCSLMGHVTANGRPRARFGRTQHSSHGSCSCGHPTSAQ